MPDPAKPGKRSGRIIVGVIAVLGVAAALGTCTRFASDNPYSSKVQTLNERTVSAQFDTKAAVRVQPRMMAVLSFEESDLRREGRVKDVRGNAATVTVVVEFPDNLPDLVPARVSVDTSFPPEVLK